MINKGQVRWATIYLVGLLALIGPLGSGILAQNFSWRDPASITSTKPVFAPVLVSGTASSMWLAEPLLIEADNDKRPAFKLLQHEADKRGTDNQDLWNLAQEPGKPPVIIGSPAQLIAGSDGVYVIMESGVFIRARLSGAEELTRLPLGQKVYGAAGSDKGLFALTRGPAVDTTEPVASGPASRPAADVWSVLRYTGGEWVPTMLGRVGDADVPASDVRVLLADQGGQVAVFWFSPAAPRTLLMRLLDSGGGAWSEVKQVDTGEEMTRLLGVTILPQSFVFWPVKVGGQIELHGRIFNWSGSATRQAGPAANSATQAATRGAKEAEVSSWAIAPLKLGVAADAMEAARDVGIARTANSLMVVIAGGTGKEGEFASYLFETTGRALKGPMKIVPAVGGDSMLTENALLAVTVSLLLISMWHWRKRPEPAKWPKELKIPLLRKRILAGAIDLGLPFIGVVLVLGLWQDWKWWQLFVKWAEAAQDVRLWTKMPELIWVLGIYVGHVMAGELLVGRSIGKAIVGLRVVGIDGKPAEPIAIVLRNLVRLPEMMTGILLLCVLVNDQRQRFGDWVGRTVVVEGGEGEESAGEMEQ